MFVRNQSRGVDGEVWMGRCEMGSGGGKGWDESAFSSLSWLPGLFQQVCDAFTIEKQ